MIFKWVVVAFSTFVNWLIAHFPAPSVPSWLTGLDTSINSYFSDLHLGAWFPGSIVTTVLTAWAGAYSIAITIRLMRMIASFLTGGGGSVA